MKRFVVLLSVVIIMMAFIFSVPALAAKPGGGPEICDNGIDDDGDKKVDCNDSDCVGEPACPFGTCSNYTEKDACNADPYCEWLGKGQSAYCADAVSGLPPVNQFVGFLDTSSEETEVPHDTAEAQAGNCTFCHGDIVDNMDDGHIIPTYEPSLVTPWPSGKNQGGEGNCTYCHYAGVYESSSGPVLILDNASNHHNTGLYDKKGTKCAWCHDVFSVRPASITISAYSIRTCEGCHGYESLHSIQVDSDGDGVITPGAELPGFGHIGSNDDCNGCHGIATAAAAMTQSASESAAVSAAETHHRLVGDPMIPDSEVPNASETYECMSCHTMTGSLNSGSAIIAPANDCLACHLDGPPSN